MGAGDDMKKILALVCVLAGCSKSTPPAPKPTPMAAAPIPMGGDIANFSNDAAVVGIQSNPIAPPDAGGTSILYTASNSLTWAIQGGSEVFGDGSDGVATFDGSATPLGSVLSAGNYTILRNVYYSSVNVHTGVTVSVATAAPPVITGSGYGIFCNGNFINNGIVSAAGGTTTTATGGKGFAHGSVGNYFGGANGGNGSTGSGAAGVSFSATAYGGAGGAGGAGGTGAAGAGGSVVLPSNASFPRTAAFGILGYTVDTNITAPFWVQYNGGAGGGGGGGDGANSGGGGGGGGGILEVTAASLSGTGSFTSAGGKGANSAAAGNTGGGGGGGGGVTVVYFGTSSYTGTFSAAGGAGGTAHGTGSAGTAGTAGTLIDTGL
jgi:hypothetical protein